MRRGSVLMEFVVVAPLYFAILGGMFIVGDLVTNSARMHMGDFFVTWVGGGRFCPVDANGDEDAKEVKALLKPLYDLSLNGAVDGVGFKVDYEKGAEQSDQELNCFMRFYMGKVKELPISMPGYISGMFSMEDAMHGKDGADEYATVTFKRTEKDDFRSFSFHRQKLFGIDDDLPGGVRSPESNSRGRGIRASEMVQAGYLGNVIAEGWASDIGEEGDAPTPSIDDLQPGVDVQHSRVLGMFGE